jgi:hypothetical protein
MAGIWGRIDRSGQTPDSTLGRLNIWTFESSLVLASSNTYTPAEVLVFINAQFVQGNNDPLDAAEQLDLTNLLAVMNSQGGSNAFQIKVNRLVWLAKAKAVLVLAEQGLIDETEFRTKLGITL